MVQVVAFCLQVAHSAKLAGQVGGLGSRGVFAWGFVNILGRLIGTLTFPLDASFLPIVEVFIPYGSSFF